MKYPVLFLIHGGPQGAWGESWTYRWNAQVFAAARLRGGDAEPAGLDRLRTEVHRRHQRGLGRQGVRGHHGRRGLCRRAAVRRPGAHGRGRGLLRRLHGRLDARPHRRFKALVSHAGVFDLRSEFGETEELWFPLWEFRGAPWDDPEMYARWCPSFFVKEFKTPTLVTHGELDYRVPVGQGMQLFTACSFRRSRPSWCCSPTKATGSRSRRTRCSGTGRSSSGSIPG